MPHCPGEENSTVKLKEIHVVIQGSEKLTKLYKVNFHVLSLIVDYLFLPNIYFPFEPRREKTSFSHMRKQRRRSASR